MQIGDKIVLNRCEWRVLDIQKGAALIITEVTIEQRPYHDAYKDITWADCALRKYLNGEFYDKFNEADQSRIIPVLNKNPDNQWYVNSMNLMPLYGGQDTVSTTKYQVTSNLHLS